MTIKSKILDFGGMTIRAQDVQIGYTKPNQATPTTTALRQHVVPICGNAKVGATAGWVITGGTNICHATLPASQTGSTLVVPITGLHIGDTLVGVSLMGQVESAGNTATISLDVRKLTNVAADNTDASLGTDNTNNFTADGVISSTNVAVTGLSQVMSEGITVYALVTATTAASTDIDLTGMLVTVSRAV